MCPTLTIGQWTTGQKSWCVRDKPRGTVDRSIYFTRCPRRSRSRRVLQSMKPVVHRCCVQYALDAQFARHSMKMPPRTPVADVGRRSQKHDAALLKRNNVGGTAFVPVRRHVHSL